MTESDYIVSSSNHVIRTVQFVLTRAANSTPYLANDVILQASGLIQKFLNVNKAPGTGSKIIGIAARTTDNGLAGKSIKLHLYRENLADGTLISDNAVFSMDSQNFPKRIGTLQLQFGTGDMSTAASDFFQQMGFNPTGMDLFFQLQVMDAYTPALRI